MAGISNIILPFVHILSGICFVGLNIGLRANANFYLVDDEKHISKSLKSLKKQIYFMLILMIILAASAIYMLDYNINNPLFNTLASTQWSLYICISINLIYMYYQYSLCVKVKEDRLLVYNEKITLIIYYFITLNIALSFIGVLFALIISSVV